MNSLEIADPTGQLNNRQGNVFVAISGICCTLGGILYYEPPVDARLLQKLGSRVWFIPGAAVLLYSIDYLLFLLWYTKTGRAFCTLSGSLISETNYGRTESNNLSWGVYACFGRNVPLLGVLAWIPCFIVRNWIVLRPFITFGGSMIPGTRKGGRYDAVRSIGSLPILGLLAWIGFLVLIFMDSHLGQTITFGFGNFIEKNDSNKNYYFLSNIPFIGGLLFIITKGIISFLYSHFGQTIIFGFGNLVKKNDSNKSYYFLSNILVIGGLCFLLAKVVDYMWNDSKVIRAVLTLGGSLVCLSESMKSNHWYKACADFGRNFPLVGFLAYFFILGGLCIDFAKRNYKYMWNESRMFRAILTLGGSLVCLSESMKSNDWYKGCAAFGKTPVIGFLAYFLVLGGLCFDFFKTDLGYGILTLGGYWIPQHRKGAGYSFVRLLGAIPMVGIIAWFLYLIMVTTDSKFGQTILYGGGNFVDKSEFNRKYYFYSNFPLIGGLSFLLAKGLLFLWNESKVFRALFTLGGSLICLSEEMKTSRWYKSCKSFGRDTPILGFFVYFLVAGGICVDFLRTDVGYGIFTLGGSQIVKFKSDDYSPPFCCSGYCIVYEFGMIPLIGCLAWIPFLLLKVIETKLVQTILYGGGNLIIENDQNAAYHFLSNVYLVGGLAYCVAKAMNTKIGRGISTLGANIFLPVVPFPFGQFPLYTSYLKPLANVQIIGIPVHILIWVAYFPILSGLLCMERIWFRPSLRIGIWKINSFLTILSQRRTYTIRKVLNLMSRLKVRYILNYRWEWRPIKWLPPLGSFHYAAKPAEECMEEPIVLTMERYKLQLEMFDTRKISRCALDTVNLALGIFVKNQAMASDDQYIPPKYKMYADTEYRDRFGAPLFNHRQISVLKVAESLANSGCKQDDLLTLKLQVRTAMKKNKSSKPMFLASYENQVNQIFIDFLSSQSALELGDNFNALAVEHATFLQSEIWTRAAVCSALDISEENLLWVLSRSGTPESFRRGKKPYKIDYSMYAIHHIINRTNTHAGPWEFQVILSKMKKQINSEVDTLEAAENLVEEAVVSILELASELPPIASAAV